MKVPQASIFAQTTKGMSNGAPLMAAPTDTQASEFSGLISQETGETAEGGQFTDLAGQFAQGQSDGEQGTLSPEALSAVAGMIVGVMPKNGADTTLLPTNPEGPTGSLLSPAALGEIPTLSYALTGSDELTALNGNTEAATTLALNLNNGDAANIGSALPGDAGKQLLDGQNLAGQTPDANKAEATLSALKNSISTTETKVNSGSKLDNVKQADPAIQSIGTKIASNGDIAEQFEQPHQALQSALDAHLSAQRLRNADSPNWGGNARPQMPRGAMATRHTQTQLSSEDTLGEAPQIATQVNQALTQAKNQWANGNQVSQARLNTAENIADIKSDNIEGDIPDLPLAARIIQRSHYAHNMTRPNQTNKVEIDPALTVEGSDTSVTENPEMAISEIYEETIAEASEMMTPEGIVRAPTNMQIDVDGDLSVEIEAVGNEVHVTLDGTKSALDEMKGVRAEIAESLEDGEMDLGEFSTNTRDGDQKDSNSKSRANAQSDSLVDSAANNQAAQQTIVQHGSSVSAVA